MIVLAVDASGPVAGMAISKDGHIVYEAVQDNGKTHSVTLMPMIDGAMEAAGLGIHEIDLLACVAGPGSFTGVRIGVCAVQALGEATGKKCLALDALEVLAMGQWGFEGTVCPILDARRGQVYAAAFRFEETVLTRMMDDAALPLEDYLASLPGEGRLLFVGDGVAAHGPRVKTLLGERALVAPSHRARIMPGAACLLTEIRQGEAVDAASLAPIYLRRPQAEREREERIKCPS